MAAKGRCYRVRAVGKFARRSYPLHEVTPGAIVKALENAPPSGVDVITVRLPSGKEADVYSFQLDLTRCPRKLRSKR